MIDQDECEHLEFDDETEKCVACGMPCKHWEIDEGVCIDCGRLDDREPPDDDSTDFLEDSSKVS